MVRTYYNRDLFEKFTTENNILLLKGYNNIKITREIKIEARCTVEYCQGTFIKSFRHLIKNGAYCSECMLKLSNITPVNN